MRLRVQRRGHAPPKLHREQVGPVAKAYKKCSVEDLLAFIKQKLGVEVDRLTLRCFLKRYGLGCLREEEVHHSPPFAGATAFRGAFILMGEAVRLHQVATRCFSWLGGDK